ncbi:hypothetical protein [Arsukibacterium ikkense]|nr:hypothetical protein [Arsukibacterium ikkense]
MSCLSAVSLRQAPLDDTAANCRTLASMSWLRREQRQALKVGVR